MIFNRSKHSENPSATQSKREAGPANTIVFLGINEQAARSSNGSSSPEAFAALSKHPIIWRENGATCVEDLQQAQALVSVHLSNEKLSETLSLLKAERTARADGLPVLIVVVSRESLADLGIWLHQEAEKGQLEGIRLILADSPAEFLPQIPPKLEPILESNIIKMPVSTEVEEPTYKYFYCISPQLRRITKFMRGLAENEITRMYLLGGPGAGKTSIAYYYYLCRKKGNFITVNLTAESTNDKGSMKSLLCGHVAGAFPGSGAREGALSFARDGVCFLDESHGVSGIVMEVLMEVLDSGQFLPFGATNKRALDCAVIFATNRSWEHLREQINIDEHARLGATLVEIPDLSAREEDLIAVLAASLAKFRKQCSTWKSPVGLSREAWNVMKNCPWHGNIRTLMRVTETACVQCASTDGGLLLQPEHVQRGIDLWEPAEHQSYNIYTSYQ